ncbi:3'-5' exonuclease [Corynebacterium sp. SCR221107]|uniref:3'-5' exonuclease n=1 Tax=Corynebacterium sp. SCR221107 TaxID=3017361 RepID=UPI0022EC58E4|nr:3'-5' exonuclease [Corynebacterium sp. SCR221107]WBT09821.1 3'-5' exonuclease [Corynebacterium sp. SCR221107]
MTSVDPATARFNPQAVLSFDLETTHSDPFRARIVTSALVRIDASGVHPYEMLADPGVDIPEEATRVHGITTEYARAHGRPHDEVLAETVSIIRKAWEDGLTLIVFNAAYDLTVVRELSGDFLVTGPVFDPYVIDKALDPYRRGKRTLSDQCQHYGVRIDNAHEATSDALAAARIAWVQAKKHYVTDIEEKSLNELMEYQAVEYFKSQTSLKSYLEGQGRDASSVNTSWPLQSARG